MKTENIFSFSREAMLKKCCREYYLHAFYAYGEYDTESADHERNYVHLLKQLKSETVFKEALMMQSLHKVFIEGMNIDELPKSLRSDFFLAKDDMLLGLYENDHLANPLLRSFYYDEANIEELFTNIHNDLSLWTERLLENDLFLKLFHSERHNFYMENDVASVYIGNIKMYFPLFGIIKSEGLAYCISFVRRREFFDTGAVLNLLYCQNKLHIPPHNIRHVFLNEADSLYLFTDNESLNISRTLDDIINRADSHFYFANQLENYFSPFAVPEADSKESCCYCRFREFCKG